MSQPAAIFIEPPTVTDPVTDPAGQDPPEPTGTTAVTDQPATDPPTEPKPSEMFGDVAFEDLPAATQKEIRQLRAEAAKTRTQAIEKATAEARNAAEAEAKAALEQERAANAERLKRIARELGLAGDEQTELTPEQVIEQITKERDEAKAASEDRDKRFRELSLEVAVQDAAAMHEARADRLLDSRTFMKQVRGLDPDSEGYRAAVAEAVEKAVEADADLKAVKKPAPPAVSGGTTVAGSKTRRAEDMTIEELIDAGFTKRR